MEKTLEQLRAEQEAYKERRQGRKAPPPTEAQKQALTEYAKKVFKLEPEDSNIGQVLNSINKPKQLTATMGYQAARKNLWLIMKEFAHNFPGGRFVVDQQNKAIIQNLLKYFLGLDGEYSTQKGLYIYGPTGTGKTALMRVLSKFSEVQGILHQFKYYSAHDIYNEYKQNGDLVINHYKAHNICIDDLGAEPPIYKLYGNDVMPLMDLLTERHKRWERGAEDSQTFVTSNLSLEEIKERYGQRIYDRFKMFNIIKLAGKSRR